MVHAAQTSPQQSEGVLKTMRIVDTVQEASGELELERRADMTSLEWGVGMRTAKPTPGRESGAFVRRRNEEGLPVEGARGEKGQVPISES